MRHMLLTVLALCLMWSPTFGRAEDVPPRPKVTAELSTETVAVGQPVVLRITVLVPTWMPSPPVFPSFETPNLMVRLPERASGPVSQKIDGQTWSGISRAYRLYPMVPGRFTMPSQKIELVYAAPPTPDPVSTSVTLPELTFVASVPEDARDLSPLIVAQGLTLTEELEGFEDTLAPGDAVTRTITTKVTGTSPLFVPPLLAPFANEAIQPYPKEATVTESENRGILSGVRVDTVTYVARYGGQVILPEIQVQWFDIENDAIVTETLAEHRFHVDGPAAPREPLFTPKQITILAGAAVVLGLIVWGFIRYVWPVISLRRQRRKEQYLQSEVYAASLVRAAIQARDLHETAHARQIWERRTTPAADNDVDAFEQSLFEIGRARFGSVSHSGEASWNDVMARFEALRTARLAVSKKAGSGQKLVPLNPF